MSDGPENYFQLLGVERGVSPEELKTAFRNCSKRLHPQGSEPDEERFKAMKNAYDVLRDTDERKIHEAKLDQAEQKAEKEKKRKARAPGTTAGAAFGEDLGGASQSPPPPPQPAFRSPPPEPSATWTPPPPTEPVPVAPRPVGRTVGVLGVIVLWAFLVAVVSLGMSLAGAYLGRHSVGDPGDIHQFIPMTGYLLELSIAAGVAALAAIAITELMSVRGGEPPGRYGPAIVLQRPIYALTLAAAAVALIILDELVSAGHFTSLGPGSSWWWILGPASLCVAHVLSLTVDRWRVRPSFAVLMIPMAASCGAIACGLLFAWPLPHIESHSETITDRAARGVEPCHFSGPEWLWHTHPEEVLVCNADPTRRVVMAFYSGSAGAGIPLEREAQLVGAERTGTCPDAAPVIHAFYYSDEQRAGSVLCYRRNDHIIYAWSDLEECRFTKVYFWHIRSFKVAQKRWEQLAF